MSSRTQLDSLFDNLWNDYISFNPQAKRIYDILLKREQALDPNVKTLVNDHVALRTYNIQGMALRDLGRMFEKYGYKKGGEYVFKDKKLFAYHYEHDDKSLPKVFISELECEKFSSLVQSTAKAASAALPFGETEKDSFLWSRRAWAANYATYTELLKESEYAAWLYAFGFRSNHFTIAFNNLKSFSTLEELNEFIIAQGYPLNGAGGVIKGTPAQYLEQSSTLAEKATVEFADGKHDIPACYYEFARRYPLADGSLYQGFVAASADKIFESTDVNVKAK